MPKLRFADLLWALIDNDDPSTSISRRWPGLAGDEVRILAAIADVDALRP